MAELTWVCVDSQLRSDEVVVIAERSDGAYLLFGPDTREAIAARLGSYVDVAARWDALLEEEIEA